MDVLVVGGGPSGLSTALALRNAGRSVVVLERSPQPMLRIGETLPPEIRIPLTALGLWNTFLAAGHSPSPGIMSIWEDPEPYHNDFLCNAYGHGWHIDRRRFDAMLASAVGAHGATVLQGACLTSAKHSDSRWWDVRATATGIRHQFSASVLVDATGRAAALSRRLGARRIVVDRLVGLVRFVADGADACDQRTLVESTPDGWWYSASLPGVEGPGDGRQSSGIGDTWETRSRVGVPLARNADPFWFGVYP